MTAQGDLTNEQWEALLADDDSEAVTQPADLDSDEDDEDVIVVRDIRPLAVVVMPEPAEPEQSLDALLEESVEDDLDALLNESTALVQESRLARAVKDRLKRGGQSARERAEDEARLAAWQAKHEWEAVGNCALFNRFACACGEVRDVFAGLMLHERHRHVRTGFRWRAVEASQANLPNEVAVREHATPICFTCAPTKGWDMAKATIWQHNVEH